MIDFCKSKTLDISQVSISPNVGFDEFLPIFTFTNIKDPKQNFGSIFPNWKGLIDNLQW